MQQQVLWYTQYTAQQLKCPCFRTNLPEYITFLSDNRMWADICLAVVRFRQGLMATPPVSYNNRGR